MDPEIKAKYIEALRSGKYIQRRGGLSYQLRDGTMEYCALGVLGLVVGVDLNSYEVYDKIKYAAKLTTDCEAEIIAANDLSMYSFTQIADDLESGKIC